MGILYQAADPIYWVIWLFILFALMAFNELGRVKLWCGLVLFALVPIALTLFVWPETAAPGNEYGTGTWFNWVKTYSALAGCLGFIALRFVKWRGKDGIPVREALGAVLPAAHPGDQYRRGGHPRLPGVRLRAVGGRRRREPLDDIGPVEHHERHRGHLEHPHHLRLVRHLHLEGSVEGHDLAGHDLGLDHRLRSLELRLHLQLHLGSLRLLRPGAAFGLHHPDVLHQARRVAAAPGADAGALDHVRDDGAPVRRRARPHSDHAQPHGVLRGEPARAGVECGAGGLSALSHPQAEAQPAEGPDLRRHKGLPAHHGGERILVVSQLAHS